MIGTLLFFLTNYSIAQERYLHFTEIDGLPRNVTTCLQQDTYGYLWVGTTNGIARFDGKNFYKYPELAGINIIYLLYDSHNTLWAATGSGLYRYNRLTNYFELVVRGYVTKIQEDNGEIYFMMVSNIYKLEQDKPRIVIARNNLTDFCISAEGIWLGSNIEGLMLLSRKSNFTKQEFNTLSTTKISILNKIDNQILAGAYNGKLYVVTQNRKSQEIKLNNHYFYKRFVKIGNEIWLATDGFGIIVLDKNLQYLRTLNKSSKSDASISSNSIYDILQGAGGEVWLASYGSGLNCILPDNLLFRNFLPEKGNENSLVAEEGVSVFSKNSTIYFGTNYGLSVWDGKTEKYKNLSGDILQQQLKGNKVTAITADHKNNIWIGTYDGLLGKYSPDLKLFKTFHPGTYTPDEMQQIVYLQEVSDSNILIQTQLPNTVLINFNTKKETSEIFELYAKGSKVTYFLMNSLRKNQQGDLLALISDKGLFHVNWKDNILENRLVEMNKKINSYISDFYHDKKGYYWFATSSNGLVRISKDGKGYKKYTVKEGLPSNTLVRIESVDNRFLWISTISGICRFDTETGQALNFNHNDGLPANEFFERTSGKTDDSKIIFGSLAGFTVIDPTKVNAEDSKTKIIISDITFQNQSIRTPDGEQFLTQALEDTKIIELPYRKNSFTIHFFAQNKSFAKYQNYLFRLVGFEKKWNYLGEVNYATYTNLSQGTYTFEIKSAEKTNESLITKLTIRILSPWYLSWYAYTSYTILFVVILYLSVYGYLKRMEVKKEKEIAEFKIQKEQELTEKKLAFFTNISHDLKTPLTLIEAPVSDLLHSDNLNPEQVNKLMIISRNSKRLHRLITDLLDFRKITQKQFSILSIETDISHIITEVTDSFTEECINKSIDFKCTTEKKLIGLVDRKSIEKILWNLLSNALKFTNKGGSISINAKCEMIDQNGFLNLTVSDTGIGISAIDKEKIFERFFKVENTGSMNQDGTGIGLSIVKELVEMQRGKIQVESELGKGTVFTITLPLNKEILIDEKSDEQITNNETVEIENNTTILRETKKQYNLPGILIVEDNLDLLNYLAANFEKKYKVYLAEDGLQGLKLATQNNVDLIITDVQMPNMNGYEFCRELRRNFDTSHIPIIMLTANITIEHQIEGLSTGADVYLTKPFNVKILDAQVNSLLENRKTLRHKFLKMESPENLENTLPQKDIDFIGELRLFIEENIINSDLSVELLSKHFAISLAQLHRKIKALTGTTPNNLIKSIRLKKAWFLIREGGLRVSEAAYQTGFSDPNYFTICFKKEFGENPSQININEKDRTTVDKH